MIRVKGYKIKLADKSGAGDALTAGFIHKLLNGATMKDAAEFGTVLASIVCTQKGSTGKADQQAIDGFSSKSLDRTSDFYFDCHRYRHTELF